MKLSDTKLESSEAYLLKFLLKSSGFKFMDIFGKTFTKNVYFQNLV